MQISTATSNELCVVIERVKFDEKHVVPYEETARSSIQEAIVKTHNKASGF